MNLKTKLADNLRSGTIGAALTILVGLCLWRFQIGAPLSYDLPFVFVRQVITNEVILIKMDDASSLLRNPERDRGPAAYCIRERMIHS